MSDPDLATWYTKEQAATVLQKTVKTVERLAKAGKIQWTHYRRPQDGRIVTVYYPLEVDQLAQAGTLAPPEPFLVPVPATAPTNGNGHRSTALKIATAADLPSGEDLLRLLVTAAVKLAETSGATSATPATSAYVDRTEALAIAGVSSGQLRAAVQAGEVKQRGRRYRRTDLEAL